MCFRYFCRFREGEGMIVHICRLMISCGFWDTLILFDKYLLNLWVIFGELKMKIFSWNLRCYKFLKSRHLFSLVVGMPNTTLSREPPPEFKSYKNQYQDPKNEVLTTKRPCNRYERCKVDNDVEVLSRNLLNINLSSEDPSPRDWNPKDPLLITTCIRQKQIHCIYIGNRK